jgi:hypothetical protein
VEVGELDELLSRQEVLGGLPARRARALLFLIDQHTARFVASREIGTMSQLGERSAEARELAWVEHFAMDREPEQPTIQEIEAAAGEWGPHVPAAASIRAATTALLAERYPLDRRRLPRTVAALGLDEPAVATAYERQSGQPIDRLWTRSGPIERLRWAISAPGRWLEETTPLKAAAALTFLTSIGQSVVVVPIAIALIGPIAAIVSVAVIGLLAVSATAAMSETAARSGEMRFRGGFFGRLVAGSLGVKAAFVPAGLGILGVVLHTVSALIGLGLLLTLVIPLPAAGWAILAGVLVTIVQLRDAGASTSFGGLLSFGLFSITMLGLFSVVILVLAATGDGLYTPSLGAPAGIGVEVALGIAIGNFINAYADPVYATQIGKVVLPHDPDGKGLIKGSMLGMAAFVVFTLLFGAVVLLTLPTSDFIGLDGSVMDPLATRYGALVTVMAGAIGIALFGMRLYGSAISLYDFVDEQLPGRKLPRVVLAAGRGRVVLADRGGESPPIALTYRGNRAGKAVLAISQQGGGGDQVSERMLSAGSSEDILEVKTGLRVLEADGERLLLELDTPLQISYDDTSALLGRGVAETLLAEDGSGALVAWLLRSGGAEVGAAAEYLGVSPGEARARLDGLVEEGSARLADGGRYEPLMAARRRRTGGLDEEQWNRLAKDEDSAAESTRDPVPAKGRLAAIGGKLGRGALCSLPMVALTALCAVLLSTGSGSVAGPLKITGVIVVGMIAGVLPPLLLVASRRRPELAGVARGGWIVGLPLLAAMMVGAMIVFVLHATILWTDPIEQAMAAASAVVGVVVVVLSFRHGSFQPTAVLDVREREGDAGLDLVVESDGVVERPRLRVAGADLPDGARPELGADDALDVAAHSGTSNRLRVSAQREETGGGGAALALEVELQGAELSEVHRLDELGGVAVFDLDSPDWTLVVRRPRSEAAPAEAADPDPGPDPPMQSRRKRGGGDSPLDKL